MSGGKVKLHLCFKFVLLHQRKFAALICWLKEKNKTVEGISKSELKINVWSNIFTHVTELDRTFWTHCSSSDPLFNLVNTPAFFGLLQACVWAAAAVCPSVRPPSAIRQTGKKRKGLLLIINRCCVMLSWIKWLNQVAANRLKTGTRVPHLAFNPQPVTFLQLPLQLRL